MREVGYCLLYESNRYGLFFFIWFPLVLFKRYRLPLVEPYSVVVSF